MSLSHKFQRQDEARSADEAFEVFWRAYPRRIAKGKARVEFAKAMKKTTLERMLQAIRLYAACKPEWQDFAHPSSWLHQERWDDEWEAPAPRFIPNKRESYADAFKEILGHERAASSANHPAFEQLSSSAGHRQEDGPRNLLSGPEGLSDYRH